MLKALHLWDMSTWEVRLFPIRSDCEYDSLHTRNTLPIKTLPWTVWFHQKHKKRDFQLTSKLSKRPERTFVIPLVWRKTRDYTQRCVCVNLYILTLKYTLDIANYGNHISVLTWLMLLMFCTPSESGRHYPWWNARELMIQVSAGWAGCAALLSVSASEGLCVPVLWVHEVEKSSRQQHHKDFYSPRPPETCQQGLTCHLPSLLLLL